MQLMLIINLINYNQPKIQSQLNEFLDCFTIIPDRNLSLSIANDLVTHHLL
jgi:hypothetical protein